MKQMFVFFRQNDFDYNFESPSPGNFDTPNPGTPGYPADTPSPIGGPFTPQTPGTSYSPYGGQSSASPGSYHCKYLGHLFIKLIKNPRHKQ